MLRNNQVIATWEESGEEEGLTMDIFTYDTPAALNQYDTFYLEDVTFDGNLDLVLRTNAGAYNFTYAYFAYNPSTHVFDKIPLVEATNQGFDPKTKSIYSYSKGRGLGDYYIAETFTFEDGKYVLTEVVSQDIIDWEHEETSDYVRITKQRKNGELVEVKREVIPRSEIWGNESGS